MVTIESCRPDIWHMDNLIACTGYCLNTLLRWITIGYCPHFTTSGVNLFDGKLNMCCVYQIKMDMLGFRLLPAIRILDDSRGHINQLKILRKILILIPNEAPSVMSELTSASRRQNIHEAVEGIIGHLRHLHSTLYSGSSLDCDAASLHLPHLYGILASTLASYCINRQLPVTQFVINLYQVSFTSDLMSTKLKYASMLFCSGE